MAIGINEIDENIDDFSFEEQSINENENQEQNVQPNQQEEDPFEDNVNNDQSKQTGDFVSELLKSRGISDPSKVLYENEDGEVEEVDWNSLSIEDQLNIINTSSRQAEDGLDESEIQLINAIRQSELTPKEYIQWVQKNAVENYTNNSANQNVQYSINDYTDEELFVMDLLTKVTDITDQEAIEALQRAKVNEVLFHKQMESVRAQYQQKEDEKRQNEEFEQEEIKQAQFKQFADSIGNSIMNFNEFGGWNFNMSDEDRNYLYQFITGRDNANNSWFGKALNDPDTVVQMAWFVLNGKEMIQSITNYYENEITNVRKNSYKKGLEDSNKNQSVYKQKDKPNVKNTNRQVFDDLDEY